LKNLKLILAVALFTSSFSLTSQGIFDTSKGCVTDANQQCVPNTILSAVPFLRITPDARSGAMGNVGLATSIDPNAMFHNTSKLAFAQNELGISTSYTPWLRQLGLSDVNLISLSAYKKIDKLQSIGFGLKYFGLGQIDFTDFNGNPIGQGKPNELEFVFGYARKLGSNFSAGINLKYINSNLANGASLIGVDLVSGNSIAADISFMYKKQIHENELTIATTVANLGSGISYSGSILKDPIPANFGLGATYKVLLDEYNTLAFSIDMNKLLVPSPIAPRISDGTSTGRPNPAYDQDGSGIPDYREKGILEGILGSFTDAQGGLSEELNEITYSLGLEYWYDQQFAVRAGYFHESFLKGDRKFLTLGLGIKYNVFGLDLSYLVPSSNRRSPLDNTLRFSFNLGFGAFAN